MKAFKTLRAHPNGIHFSVLAEENGCRLLAYLRGKLSPKHSVKSIKRAIDGKMCLINGRVENFSTHVLATGDFVSLDETSFDKEERKGTAFSPVKAEVLYEDEDLLICHKPAGIVSEKGPLNQLLPAYRGRLLPVHRLDKETSGALLMAKTAEAEKLLIALFAERTVKKLYVALVHGQLRESEGKIDNFLSKKNSYQGQTIWGATPKGLRAITHWKVLQTGSPQTRSMGVSLVSCQPITGRTHQLRVHLSEKGHPILGDTQYGTSFASVYRAPRILLHAHQLSFIHPKTGVCVGVTAPLPEDFREALKTCNLSLL